MEEGIGIEEAEELLTDLRMMARGLLNGEYHAHSVQATGLVMSALRRSKGCNQSWEDLSWANREEFLAIRYRHMRRTLVDYARKRNAKKRPPLDFIPPEDYDKHNYDLYDLPSTARSSPPALLALYEAMDWLKIQKPEVHLVMEHHYLLHFKIEQISQLIDKSAKTVKRRLSEGRLLLKEKTDELLRDATSQ